jgi:hypothetical protein
VTTQFPNGSPARFDIALTAGERRELTQGDLPAPPNSTFGVVLDSANGVGIVAERVSTGATESGAWRRSAIGAMQPGTKWIFPAADLQSLNDTDLVVMNISDTTARVKIQSRAYLFECCDVQEGTVEVPARGIIHVPIGYKDPASPFPIRGGGMLTIESLPNGSGTASPIVVERTYYSNQDGVRHARTSGMIGNQVQ